MLKCRRTLEWRKRKGQVVEGPKTQKFQVLRTLRLKKERGEVNAESTCRNCSGGVASPGCLWGIGVYGDLD